ncbi:hypothetical protein B0J12DRAFT_606491, partial [Macrophomina phaseolina]
MNPEPTRAIAPITEATPLQATPDQHLNTLEFLSSIINRVQKHKHSAYCERKKKNSNEVACRFYFPKHQHGNALIIRDFNPIYYSFDGARNDEWLNNYCRVVSYGWLANTDVTPCTGSQAVLNYIAKYCSTAETKSVSYKQIIQSVLPNISSTRPLLSLVSRVMNKLLGERDWSTQEVSHLLLNLPLQQGSRTVINVDCRPEDQQPITFDIDRGQTKGKMSLLQRYKQRCEDEAAPAFLENLTYLDMLLNFNFTGQSSRWSRRTRGRPRVLNYFPRYKPEGSQYEDYCRVKMMLHHKFKTRIEEIFDEFAEWRPTTWAEAYEVCRATHTHHLPDYLDELPTVEDDDEFELDEDEEELIHEEWTELARQLPHRELGVQDVNPDDIGDRDIDRQYDWMQHVGIHVDVGPDWFQQMKDYYPASARVGPVTQGREDTLASEQRKIFDLCIQHFKDAVAAINNDSRAPLP